ncbi:MAG: hypothetical protein BAJATHORv1_60110 [Candidatus Thorarchaeota archaeon]|nr:MAG: hypothetical protein BAJATHORv1_60110 [Candidatus Thorarchaeota archaeon]
MRFEASKMIEKIVEEEAKGNTTTDEALAFHIASFEQNRKQWIGDTGINPNFNEQLVVLVVWRLYR